MAFENNDYDLEPEVEEAGPAPEEASNRPFWLALAGLGGLFLLTLICLVAFVLARPLLDGSRANLATQAAEINQQNTAVAFGVTRTQAALAWTPTPTRTVQPTNTPRPATATPVVARRQATSTPSDTGAERTATVAALLTLAATNNPPTATVVSAAGLTATARAASATTVGAATALPNSGFADDVGAPGMLALALALVGVIFLARRLRTL